MNKGMRSFLIICAGIVGIGLILCIAGFVMGGMRGLSAVEDKMPWISFGGAGRVVSQDFKTKAFDSIKIESNIGDVHLIESNKYKVEVRYNKRNDIPRVDVNNKTLIVEDSNSDRHFSFNLFGWDRETNTDINVYYPKNAEFKEITLESDMGDIKVEDIRGESMEIACSAGDVKMEGVTVDSLKVDGDMGDVRGKDLKTGKGEFDLSAGDLNLAGSLKGTTKVNIDMGDCTIESDIPQNRYSMDISLDMGDCNVDGKYVGNRYERDGRGSNLLKVDGSVGDVKINF